MFKQEEKDAQQTKSKFSRFLGKLREDSILLFGGKSVDKNKSTSLYVPMTLEQIALENRRKKVRSVVGKAVVLASVSILVGSTALQAGVSIMGLNPDYLSAEAANAQGKKSTAMERSIDQLKIAAGEANGSLVNGAKALSPAEIKTIGFFVSNWYSPFVTQVAVGGGTAVGEFQQDVTDVLIQHTGLAKDPATELAEKIVEIGAKTSEILYLAKSDDNGVTWKNLGYQASYSEVLMGSVGILPDSVLTASGSGNEITLKDRYQYDAGKKTILGLVRESKSGEKDLKRQEIVYEWNPSPSGEPTIAQATFYTNFASVDSKKAWGSTVLTLDANDQTIKDWVTEQPADLAEKLNRSFNGLADPKSSAAAAGNFDGNKGSLKGFYDQSIYSAGLYVDGFGNLISNTGNKSVTNFVILPGSQNPMMYARKETSSSSSSGEKKEEKKDDKKGSSNKKEKTVEEKLADIYNDKEKGVGRSIASNNLNSVALNKGKGYLKVDGDTATLGGPVDKSLTFYTAVANGQYTTRDGADTTSKIFGVPVVNVSDLGAVVSSSLYTQWLIRNVPFNEAYSKAHGNEFKHNSWGWNYGATYEQINSGAADLGLPQGKPTNGYSVFGGGSSWFDLLAHVSGADAWSVFTAKAFNDDVYKWKSNMTVTKPVIDDIISFDDKGFAAGDPHFKKLGDNGTLLLGKAQDIPLKSSRLDGSGYWIGHGSIGGLADTKGEVPTEESDKKYAINLYASTVLVRANPFNKDIRYVINLDNSSVIDESDLDDSTPEDLDYVLKNMAYYMLNPTKGREYKQRWSKTFMNQTLLSSLGDMVGANTASSYSGTTRYLELTGFATIPKMNEIKFTDYLYSKFSSWGVTILIIASFLMIIFVFVGQIKIVPAVLSVVAFGYLLYSPPQMIDAATGLSNQISSYFFKDKFLFWVMATHQNYSDSVAQLQKAAQAGNYDNYTALLIKLQGGWGGAKNEGETDVYEWQQTLGAAVKVRWMAPKKDGYIQQVKRDLKQVTSDNVEEATQSNSSGGSSSGSSGRPERPKKDPS